MMNLAVVASMLAALSQASAQTTPPTPPPAMWFTVSMAIYDNAGRSPALALSDLDKDATVYANAGQAGPCNLRISNTLRAPNVAFPDDAEFGWRVTVRLVAREASQVVAHVDWQRTWSDGHAVSDPSGSKDVTFHFGDRLTLDSVRLPAESGTCGGDTVAVQIGGAGSVQMGGARSVSEVRIGRGVSDSAGVAGGGSGRDGGRALTAGDGGTGMSSGAGGAANAGSGVSGPTGAATMPDGELAVLLDKIQGTAGAAGGTAPGGGGGGSRGGSGFIGWVRSSPTPFVIQRTATDMTLSGSQGHVSASSSFDSANLEIVNADVWLVFGISDAAHEGQHVAVQTGPETGAFQFLPVTVSTKIGPLVVNVAGYIEAGRWAGGDEHLAAHLFRWVTTADGYSLVWSASKTIAMPKAGGVVSFDLPSGPPPLATGVRAVGTTPESAATAQAARGLQTLESVVEALNNAQLSLRVRVNR